MGTGVKLTRRAQEVAELVALGLTNREIAGRLFLSKRTVEWHLEQILNKLGFTSRSQVAAWVGRSQVGSPVTAPGKRSRGNLPSDFTSFVGRDGDMRSLLELVQANRLVTVTGPGGTGKTRLALRLARELQPRVADGTWFCDLAPVADAALVGDAVAQSVGIIHAAQDRLAAAREHLRESSALLVLDNCEHLVGASADVARDILEACPDVRVLATSRTALGVIGEAVYQLKPLEHNDAIDLFRQRATAAAPGFRLDDSNAESVAAICRRLDGVPLAIELVVPRLRAQSADELVAAVLDPAWQIGLHGRHDSLHSLAAWSYRLLEPHQQAVFRRVGVFAGWFDADDASAVAPAGGPPIRVLLSALVEQSMLVHEHTPSGARYRLLEILRAFALEQLEITAELEAARISHADRMIWLAERVDILLQGRAIELRPKVTAMMDDVRSALGTLLEVQPRRAAWLCTTTVSAWTWSGRAVEGLRWSELTIGANPDPSPQRAWSLYTHAHLLAVVGRGDEARAWLVEADALAGQPQHASLRAGFLTYRALVHNDVSDPHTADRVNQEVIQELSQGGDEVALARALNHSAINMMALERAAASRNLAQRSVDIRRRLDPSRLAFSLDTLATAYVFLGKLDQARQCWLEALEHGRDLGWGWPFSRHLCFFGLALVAGLRGNNELSLRLHFYAERLVAEAGAPYKEPLSPKEAELIARLKAEAGPRSSALRRAEAEALTPEMALELAHTE